MTAPEDKSKSPPKGSGTTPPGAAKDGGTIPPARQRDIPTIAPRAPRDSDTIPSGATGGQALYLRVMTEQLTGWNDPRAMLERALKENQFLLLAQKILPLKSGNPD